MSQRRNSWTKYKTDEGYDYYYDQESNNSQWERPYDYYSDEEIIQIKEITLEITENNNNNNNISNNNNNISNISNKKEEYQDNNYLEEENFEFEFNTNVTLFEELTRLTLFQTIQTNEKLAIRSGKWSKISCRKLEILQMCLENYGTEEEWKYIFNYENRIVMRYLLKFMHPSVHPMFQDASARCLAYAYMSYSSIWNDFLKDMVQPSPIYFYRITFIAIERMKNLVDLPPDEIPKVPYVGFDIRDVKDYNMENLEEYNFSQSNHQSTNVNDKKFDMQGSTDVSTTIAIWLLLLFEMYRTPSRVIGDDFRNRRISLLGMNLGLGLSSSNSNLSKNSKLQLKQQDSFTQGDEDGLNSNPTEKFLEMVSELLNLSKKFKETSYILCIKVIAAMNWQIPTKDIVGSTEIAEICARLQFGGDTNITDVNVSEGLLHLLNDVGYPNQKLPETLPTLQLCYDLITTPGYEGFFYVNDLKILIEVIIRELSNLPWDEDSWNPQRYDDDIPIDQKHLSINRDELIIFDGLNGPVEGTPEDVTPINELLRQMYLKLTIGLMTRTNWPTLEGYYKKSELDNVLQWWLDNGMVSCPVTVNLVSDVLDKKLGAI